MELGPGWLPATLNHLDALSYSAPRLRCACNRPLLSPVVPTNNYNDVATPFYYYAALMAPAIPSFLFPPAVLISLA